ncbi:NDR1/HIN1-like protein 26 [Andrographis paniculata]|uniref:NDR1/HIN1-like protein 26 n=1 Tax=Andrographis paniculata TaxID=175694 RepID=UPI0021E81C80|nr:NDR1/HIN1-like protein 26 [Andrographis paniculata]
MSQIHEKSPKHCAALQRKKLLLLLLSWLFILTALIIIAILVMLLLVWLLILHPWKPPQFSIREANLINSSSAIHLTLLSHNPNKMFLGIYYEDSRVHASYKGRRITPDTPVAPFYQGPQGTKILGAALLLMVRQQRNTSSTAGIRNKALSFKVRGMLRWKVGSWVSGKHRFSVNCARVAPSSSSLSCSKQGGTDQCWTTI